MSKIKYLLRFYIACALALLYGLFGYKKGLENLKEWVK
jgi:hypothetical protein